jgi:DNA polymerase III sliding clamp (beta) subunit (PCNA family)
MYWTRKIGKEEFGLKAFVSKDERKPELQKIRITKKFTEATNGHCLARIVSEYEEENFPEGPGILIDPDISIPKKELRDGIIMRDNGNETAEANAGRCKLTISYRGAEFYPPTDPILQESLTSAEDENRVQVTVDPRYLKSIAQLAIDCGSAAITLDISDKEGRGMNFNFKNQSEDKEIVGIIMPTKA